MRTTVLIPLHNSAPWHDALCEQLGELQSVARVIVSDATGGDPTFDMLRARCDHASVEWVGPRLIAPGWVAHANDIQSRARTEFVMWLPHDDRISRQWVLDAETQLDRHPDAVAACGPIDPLSLDSQGRGTSIDVPPFASNRDVIDRVAIAVDRLVEGQTSELGILFRSIARRSTVPPLPGGVIGDEWADLFWSLRLLARGPIVPISSRYGKRWHDLNTHGRWDDHEAHHPDLVRSAVWSALGDLNPEQRATVIVHAWAIDVMRHRERLQSRERHWQAMHDALWRDVEQSTSWRVTAPARAIVGTLRTALTRFFGHTVTPGPIEGSQ